MLEQSTQDDSARGTQRNLGSIWPRHAPRLAFRTTIPPNSRLHVCRRRPQIVDTLGRPTTTVAQSKQKPPSSPTLCIRLLQSSEDKYPPKQLDDSIWYGLRQLCVCVYSVCVLVSRKLWRKCFEFLAPLRTA